MRLRKTLIIALPIIVLIAGCSTPSLLAPENQLQHEYGAYDSPDALVENFVAVWENRDIDEYGELTLYDGVELAADGAAYAPFRFYLVPGSSRESWGFTEELEHCEDLFSGRPSRDGKVPGVKDIDLKLHPLGPWEQLGAGCRGDACPPGAVARLYETEMVIMLKGDGPGLSAFHVKDTVQMVAIPVMANQGELYRLWKWIDVDAGR